VFDLSAARETESQQKYRRSTVNWARQSVVFYCQAAGADFEAALFRDGFE
jgi:hypothetical protein